MATMKRFNIGAQFQNLNGRHPGQWPLLPRALCGAGVLLAVLALGWFFYWDAQLEDLSQGERREQELREAYKSKVQQAVNLDALRKQKEQVGEYVATLEKQLPSKAEMDALLSDINQAGLGRGLQFELFRPGAVAVKDYYAELPITIRVSGRYHDIGAFAADIANLSRIVTLHDLNIGPTGAARPDATLLGMDATARTYRYLDEAELAAQRGAKAGPKK